MRIQSLKVACRELEVGYFRTRKQSQKRVSRISEAIIYKDPALVWAVAEEGDGVKEAGKEIRRYYKYCTVCTVPQELNLIQHTLISTRI